MNNLSKGNGGALLSRFKNQLTPQEETELSTMMMFYIIGLDVTARELRDHMSQQQKQEINRVLGITKRMVNLIEKQYIEGDNEEYEDIFFVTQSFIRETILKQMSALRTDKMKQFLESIKYF